MAAPLLKSIAESVGSPEPAVRLILSLLIGYPFALVYRWFLFYQSATVIHLFHMFSGLALAAFNFGSQVYHSAACILVQFLMLRLMGRTVTTVLSSFIFQMLYLLAGYYYTATEEYDIKWTMPHCVLTLKLIGLSLDFYDGGKEPQRSQPNNRTLSTVPSLLEVCGFSYFYGGFLVGPQFTLQSYKKLVAGELTDCPGKPPNSALPALKKFAQGFLFLVVYAVFSPHYPDSYYLTDEFEAQPFWYRCIFILLWAKFSLYKYVTCWLIAEGVCIFSGLGYNGVIDGKHQWNACANMKVWLFETTPQFQGTIDSFNINTNEWAAREGLGTYRKPRSPFKDCREGTDIYRVVLNFSPRNVFKRCRFLGNKALSHMLTLLFLAIWHGLHSGYIICFSMEFLIITVEKRFLAIVTESPSLSKLANSSLYPLIYVVQQFIHWFFMAYSLIPFCLFTYDKWFKVHMSVYFCGHIFFIVAFFSIPYLRKVFVPKKERGQSKQD